MDPELYNLLFNPQSIGGGMGGMQAPQAAAMSAPGMTPQDYIDTGFNSLGATAQPAPYATPQSRIEGAFSSLGDQAPFSGNPVTPTQRYEELADPTRQKQMAAGNPTNPTADRLAATLRGLQPPPAPVLQKIGTPAAPHPAAIKGGQLGDLIAMLGLNPQHASPGLRLPATLGAALGGR